MKTSVVVLALVVGGLSASRVRAANPDWATGYPKPGTVAGTVLVKGNIDLGGTLTTTGAVNITIWPVNGGAARTFTYAITADQGGKINWGEFTVKGLNSGQQYNIIAQIVATDGKATFNLTTNPAKVAAK